ncbi:hypothetical protein [Haloarchaeobius sp. TZWWS8]|uniref:hypothetical protein n=1 Tax=Haloarchaeobius sp. TZWWS8 TaxID=3446121 RepID=UPI003EB95FE7
MTRFDAADPDARVELVVDAITAHRERASGFAEFTTDPAPDDDELGHGAPWVQFFDGTVAVDCTDEELDRLKSLCGEFPAATIDELVSPEEAEGTHARVTIRTDDERVAQFVDRVFTDAFERPEDYRLWVAAV